MGLLDKVRKTILFAATPLVFFNSSTAVYSSNLSANATSNKVEEVVTTNNSTKANISNPKISTKMPKKFNNTYLEKKAKKQSSVTIEDIEVKDIDGNKIPDQIIISYNNGNEEIINRYNNPKALYKELKSRNLINFIKESKGGELKVNFVDLDKNGKKYTFDLEQTAKIENAKINKVEKELKNDEDHTFFKVVNYKGIPVEISKVTEDRDGNIYFNKVSVDEFFKKEIANFKLGKDGSSFLIKEKINRDVEGTKVKGLPFLGYVKKFKETDYANYITSGFSLDVGKLIKTNSNEQPNQHNKISKKNSSDNSKAKNSFVTLENYLKLGKKTIKESYFRLPVSLYHYIKDELVTKGFLNIGKLNKKGDLKLWEVGFKKVSEVSKEKLVETGNNIKIIDKIIIDKDHNWLINPGDEIDWYNPNSEKIEHLKIAKVKYNKDGSIDVKAGNKIIKLRDNYLTIEPVYSNPEIYAVTRETNHFLYKKDAEKWLKEKHNQYKNLIVRESIKEKEIYGNSFLEASVEYIDKKPIKTFEGGEIPNFDEILDDASKVSKNISEKDVIYGKIKLFTHMTEKGQSLISSSLRYKILKSLSKKDSYVLAAGKNDHIKESYKKWKNYIDYLKRNIAVGNAGYSLEAAVSGDLVGPVLNTIINTVRVLDYKNDLTGALSGRDYLYLYNLFNKGEQNKQLLYNFAINFGLEAAMSYLTKQIYKMNSSNNHNQNVQQINQGNSNNINSIPPSQSGGGVGGVVP